MRREDKGVPRGTHLINVRCHRQDHKILVKRGRAIFLSHGEMCAEAMVNEAKMYNGRKGEVPHRGCFFFALLLRREPGFMQWVAGDFVQSGSRRTPLLRALYDAGLDEKAVAGALKEAFHRRERRRYARSYIDEYPEPFHRMPYQRTQRMYAKIISEQNQKLERVVIKLKERGFKPRDSYDLPMFRR